MKFGVVVFPGSNCDDDTVHVIGDVLGQPIVKIWHKDTALPKGFKKGDCIILPGGFSFGDYVRSGAMANWSPVMQAVKKFAAEGGYVFGICNGFQILCESGLLPGTLLHNAGQKFVCKNVYLKTISKKSPLTRKLDRRRPIKVPIAHGEGRFHADEKTLDELEANGQVLFKYCTEDGKINAAANPNGAARNIAGICNAERNVFGLMPHPERASEDVLGNTDGRAMLESLLGRVASN